MKISYASKLFVDIQEIENLLQYLKNSGIRISVDANDLVLRVGEAGLDRTVKEKIRQNKYAILSYLNRYGNQPAGAPDKDHTAVFQNRKSIRSQASPSPGKYGDECHRPLITYFENWCSISPESVALECNGQTVDYFHLNQRADSVAVELLSYSLRPGEKVAMFMDRSIDMVVSLLALFKIGAIYVPVDPDYPKERILYLLEDSDAKAILIQDHLEMRLPGTYATVISVDDMPTKNDPYTNSLQRQPSGHNRDMNGSAYIIYTSGSTGIPKGVEISHLSLSHVMMQVVNELDLDKSDIFLAMASISFDISLFELIAPLMIGAKVILLDDHQCKDAAYISDTVNRKKVTVLQATPAMWTLLNHYHWHRSSRDIKVISTGEALSKELAKEIVRRNDRLWNLYGPTETSIWATVKKIKGEEDMTGGGTWAAIGRPLKHYKTYILDKRLEPVPVGVLGELYIGGVGLSKGYVNKKDLTEERFIEIQFNNNHVERLYQTGDLVRFLPNRDIEYVRRIDDQVKINGYRIEPGEIESILKMHFSVSDAAVSVIKLTKTGISAIVAYIVPKRDAPNKSGETLNKYLSRYLPAYMLPHRYMFIEKIPLSRGGKVNRKLLPVPIITDEGDYIEPRDEMEKTIAGIFCDILEIKRIGIYDSFFDMGGSSMLAATLIIPINARYDLNISLNELLSVPPTVNSVATLVRDRVSARPP